MDFFAKISALVCWCNLKKNAMSYCFTCIHLLSIHALHRSRSTFVKFISNIIFSMEIDYALTIRPFHKPMNEFILPTRFVKFYLINRYCS